MIEVAVKFDIVVIEKKIKLIRRVGMEESWGKTEEKVGRGGYEVTRRASVDRSLPGEKRKQGREEREKVY